MVTGLAGLFLGPKCRKDGLELACLLGLCPCCLSETSSQRRKACRARRTVSIRDRKERVRTDHDRAMLVSAQPLMQKRLRVQCAHQSSPTVA